MITSLAWGLYVFGIMISTVAIASYNLDCYPEGSGEVGAWLNQSRTIGGFVVSYVQVCLPSPFSFSTNIKSNGGRRQGRRKRLIEGGNRSAGRMLMEQRRVSGSRLQSA
jgi:hypothetical protein